MKKFTISRRSWLGSMGALAMGSTLALAGGHAMAQEWPSSKPIRLVVNFAAGGAADVLARAVSPTLSEHLGQTVVIENKPGAGGNIGVSEVVRSAKDGYTLLLSSGGAVSINPLIYSKLPFNPATDLTPVSAVARIHLYLETHPSVPAKNVKEFIDYLKANPGKMSYGSPGPGSSPHLAGEMFKQMAKVDATHVPYKGAAPALTDVLSGQLQFWFDSGTGLKHVEAGKLNLLAVGGSKRSAQYPNLPTLAESGLPGFDADTLFGIYAPSGVPDAVIQRVREGVQLALKKPEVIKTIEGLGATPEPMDRDAFIKHHTVERQRFEGLIKDIGLKVD
ncbi:MAG: Bug family tripartite tricarboxylate transporter substrate binding protein [Comamonas sp.]